METSVNQSELTIRTVSDASELTPMDVAGTLCFALAVGLASEPWGVVAGVPVLVAAVATGGLLVFVVTQLTAVSLLGGAGPVAVEGAQLAASPLLANVAYGWSPDRARFARPAAGYVVALGVAWALWSTLRWAWQVAAVAVALAAAVAYGICRYERVALGLADVSGAERRAWTTPTVSARG